ncbi:hypothetical protein Q5Y75_24610 [Ruegeria sp. 2205SS24-7]|uniref:hypothetical protein n=1 Tax=Ruegeria discodermiae TaxID=3064389 RepID=UPI0027418A12|nr:hypothetical protein [Ruegeria sp. 2205SS24-7]MDP5220374.1 hypothetical protein [Ruegeria sp. 2205SS24-7]
MRAFEAAALGAPGNQALARPESSDPAAGQVIAAGCLALFHHATRRLGSGPGQGRVFGEALRDLLSAPLPEAENDKWSQDAERSLERLFRFWAAGEPALGALFEGWLGLEWGEGREALPAPQAPMPHDVVERIALVGGSYVGKSSFLFGSELLREKVANDELADIMLPEVRHAWLEGRSEKQKIASRRARWKKGQHSQTEIPDLIATTGVHDFQAFEIIDMKGEDLLPQGDLVMDYALRYIFEFRPPAALAFMLDTTASLATNELESFKRLMSLAIDAHRTSPQPNSLGTAEAPVPPVHLIANKADRLLVDLRSERFETPAKIQKSDVELLDLLCEETLDFGLLLRRAAQAASDGLQSPLTIKSLIQREALEAKVLSSSPTIGILVDRLIEREWALLSTLIEVTATNVVLNFTCSAAPGVVSGLELPGIHAFWKEIWAWARSRRHAALTVQRDGFLDGPKRDHDVLSRHLERSALSLPVDALIKSIADVSIQAQNGKELLADRLVAVELPASPEALADWLSQSGNGVLKDLSKAANQVRTLAAETDQNLKHTVDQLIHGLVTLLGINPKAKIHTLGDRQIQASIVSKEVDWLDALQLQTANGEHARLLPKIIAEDELLPTLIQARQLLDTLVDVEAESDGRSEALDFLRQMLDRRIGAPVPNETLERALPGGPEKNPRLFNRVNGALLDDCFWRNEPWRKDHSEDPIVSFILSKPESNVNDLLIELAGQPAQENKTDWLGILAPLLRLFAEYDPVFPQLAMKCFESDAQKAAVLHRLNGRRRVEQLISALKATLAARADLHQEPSLVERAERLIYVEVILPAIQSLGFDARPFEETVRFGSAAARSDNATALTSIQQSLDKQIASWPGELMSLTAKSKKLVQEIRAETSDLRNQLKDDFGDGILPTFNNENPNSLRQALKRLQAGERLLNVAADETVLSREALSEGLQQLAAGIEKMRAAVDSVENTIHSDILVERYERFLEICLEDSEVIASQLSDALGATDGGLLRGHADIKELHRRYLEIMQHYFDECADAER